MDSQLNGKIQTQNRRCRFLDEIMAKYQECNDSVFLQIAVNHLKIYEKYMKDAGEKGAAAFPNRLEYQKFEVSKLFIDRIKLLEFSLDPSFSGYKKYKDKTMSPLDAFNMTPDIMETRRMQFLHNIEKGDILHLKVVEECETEYKLLVINKYDENERVGDYLIHAFMMKYNVLEKISQPVKINDHIRAAVFGKLKREEKGFSKLLVTVNNTFVPAKYKNVKLGLIDKNEILYYPEDMSNYSSFLNYMKTEKDSDDPEELTECMTSLGLDPFKVYSFDASLDGKKLGKPKQCDRDTMELRAMTKSMNIIREAEKQILQGVDCKTVLPITEEALKIYPRNDAAFAIRGQLWNRHFIEEKEPGIILNALKDCEKALEINPYNLTATRVYLTILLLSAELYKDNGNKAKAEELEAILTRCKHICDVSELLCKGDDEEDETLETPTGEGQSTNIPMGISL